jgi:tetratricopeptide (TPR) repeat protein
MKPSVQKPNIGDYTDLQKHAELYHAECSLAKAMLTLVDGSGIIGLTRAASVLRQVQVSYALCKQIADKGKFNSQKSKDTFSVGVNLGLGAVHLFLGASPQKLVKLIDVHGTKFSSETGRMWLEKGFLTKNTARTSLCGLVLLVYYMYMSFQWGSTPPEFDKIDPIIKQFENLYPNGTITLLMIAKREQLMGLFEESTQNLTKAISNSPDQKYFHNACKWELLLNCIFEGSYREGVQLADQLLNNSNWSKCTYSYVKAILLLETNNGSPDISKEIAALMKNVPLLKKTVATKQVPMERYYEHKSNRFFEQGEKLVVPVLELFYLWRGFYLIRESAELLQIVEKQISKAENEMKNSSSLKSQDNQTLISLLRGALLRTKGEDLKAVLHFESAANAKETRDFYLQPLATLELALIDLKFGHPSSAQGLAKRAAQLNKPGSFMELGTQFLIGSVNKQIDKALNKH